MQDTIYDRHARIAAATRAALQEGGLELYLKDGFSNNATAIMVPEGITDHDILDGMLKDYNIMISGCFDMLAGIVVRIGHMGENAYEDKVEATLKALQGTLEKKGIAVKCDMADAFRKNLQI